MQAIFELGGEILERLRQNSERCWRPRSALVEEALQTTRPAPEEAPDATTQPCQPLNLTSWSCGKPLWM